MYHYPDQDKAAAGWKETGHDWSSNYSILGIVLLYCDIHKNACSLISNKYNCHYFESVASYNILQ